MKRRLIALLPLAGCLVVAAGLIALEARQNPRLSPIDEMQHVDYLYKSQDGHVVGFGELVGQDAMRETACRGIDFPVTLPSCDDASFRPEDFPEGGYDTAAIHPPTYYLISGGVGRLLIKIGLVDSLVTGGRLAGILWVGAAMILMWACLGEFDISRLTRSSLLITFVTAPVILYEAAIINPDVTAAAIGAAILLSVLAWERRRVPLIVPGLVAGGAILMKSTHMLAVIAMLIYLAVRWAQQRWPGPERSDGPSLESGPRATTSPATVTESGPAVLTAPATATEPARTPMDLFRAAVSMVIGMGVASGVLVRLQSAAKLIPSKDIPMNVRMRVNSFQTVRVADSVTWSPLVDPFVPHNLVTNWVSSIYLIGTFGLPVLAATAGLLGHTGSRTRALAIASLATLALGGPLFVVIFYFTSEVYTAVPSRYSLSLVPLLLVAAAPVVDRPIVRQIAAGFAVTATAVALYNVI